MRLAVLDKPRSGGRYQPGPFGVCSGTCRVLCRPELPLEQIIRTSHQQASSQDYSFRGLRDERGISWVRLKLYPEVRSCSRDIETMEKCLDKKFSPQPVFDLPAVLSANDDGEIQTDNISETLWP